ncbi:MAG: hypothetical protein ACRDK4_02100 [Solirubrobacteraceae bacterium]
MTVQGRLRQVTCEAVEDRTYYMRREPESRSWSVAEPDRVQLVGGFVDPGALDAEFASESRGVHEAIADVRSLVGVNHLDNALRDRLDVGAVDGCVHPCR